MPSTWKNVNPRKNTINQVAESIESIADKISTQNESPHPPETTKSKSEDEIFSEMTVKMVSGIPEFKGKYLLKLRIWQDINIRFSVNQANNVARCL